MEGFPWTVGEDLDILYKRLIDRGGFADVHEAFSDF